MPGMAAAADRSAAWTARAGWPSAALRAAKRLRSQSRGYARCLRSARLDDLDRHLQLLELRADLRGIADDHPDEAFRCNRAAERLVQRRPGLRTIERRKRLIIIVGTPEQVIGDHPLQHRRRGLEPAGKLLDAVGDRPRKLLVRRSLDGQEIAIVGR